MRLNIHLNCSVGTAIPINYNYQLSSAVYNLLKFGSDEFSTFLHNEGYKLDGKSYKLFSFALRFEKININGNYIHILSPHLSLHISSPLVDTFIKNFVIGTFENGYVLLTDKNNIIPLKIISAEIIPDPQFSNKMKFILYSPMVLSTVHTFNGKTNQYYLRPNDIDDTNRVLTKNLINKKGLIYGNQALEGSLKLEWDPDYLRRNTRITKKITINENGQYPIDVIGIQAPFTIEGDTDLIKVGYECGFGEKNSMGFGFAEVVDNQL